MKRMAFVFPGQGSQAVGMLNSFATEGVVQSILDRANEALGLDIKKLIAEGPAEDLNLTVNTQPALLAASYAMYAYFRTNGGNIPFLMAGHSLGEYTALLASKSLVLEDAIRLVRFRAEQMQQAVPVGEGSMAAILGLSDEQVVAACTLASKEGVVEAVNFNTPGQVVIAGQLVALEKAMAYCKEAGAKRALPLKVSGPFHSSLMRPAAEKLMTYLDKVEIEEPRVPIIHNADVQTHNDVAEIKEILSTQVASPVRWADTIRKMAADGVTHIFECGPGTALTGMVKRIAPEIEAFSIHDKESADLAILKSGEL